ncbi:MAG TPA: glycoside hydrolase family 27 protein, partial [Candidatus Kryptobacter bacterium]|nr:MAG: alpha-galactosidase [Ignavibacteriae bacterium 37-53-5]HQT92271.1 glycoside hydrolase family 27 protein [Candidatus Kryptobacter bacterium]
MGWNSWNKFGPNVNEQMIREMADAMVSSGMKAAGYEFINIDDTWEGYRDSLGFIHPDSTRFPRGMKALADYVHSKGLKLGIYSDCGDKTCAGRIGSRGHEYQDALSYAKWGIDYLKYDWCNTEGMNPVGAYTTMRDALYATGRPIVFSICEWGSSKPWLWAENVGNLWRTTGDISANFDHNIDHGTWTQLSVMSILDLQNGLRKYAGPGHWNDPDMLEVGNGMTSNEDRAHFSMWCMLAAPLIAGNDLRDMTPETKEILENKEVIAVDQDSLGIEGFRYSSADSIEIWFKPLERGDWAMCFLNRSLATKKVGFDFKKESVSDSLSGRNADFTNTVYSLRNLWSKKDIGNTRKPFEASVPGHDVLMLRLLKR